MKTILITAFLIISIFSNSVFAFGNIKKLGKKNTIELTLKIKSHPYSFLSKMKKPNPVT